MGGRLQRLAARFGALGLRRRDAALALGELERDDRGHRAQEEATFHDGPP
jgi:hypothetical protein